MISVDKSIFSHSSEHSMGIQLLNEENVRSGVAVVRCTTAASDRVVKEIEWKL
jgi:hypothetical protein